MQQTQPLCPEQRGEEGNARNVSPWSIESGDETIADRISASDEYDGNCRCCHLCCHTGYRICRGDHRHFAAHKIGRHLRQLIIVTLRPAILDRYIPTLDIPRFV